MPVDLAAIGADFYGWTGHKALGPTGVGVLHGRAELLESMPPFLSGGDMIADRRPNRASTWNELPWKFEAGTSMIAQAVGLGAAIDYLSELGMANVRAHERALTAYALERLAEIDGVRVFGRCAPTTAAASSRSPSRASIPTTSASCSGAAACASAPATTARSR